MSEVFGPSMFGSAFGTAENSYQISDGCFANISSIYDPNQDFIPLALETTHNAYGYITSRYNYQVHAQQPSRGFGWINDVACATVQCTAVRWLPRTSYKSDFRAL